MFAVSSAPIWRNYLAASVAAGALCSPFPATRRVFWRCKDLRDIGGRSGEATATRPYRISDAFADTVARPGDHQHVGLEILCHFWKLDSRVAHLISRSAQPDNTLQQMGDWNQDRREVFL
jgi:hypothetical protein